MKEIIEEAWETRASLKPTRALRAAVEKAIAGLDSGKLRVAEKRGGEWITHQWLKKAVLLSFRLQDNRVMQKLHYDKVPSKFEDFDFKKAGFRVVPPAAALHPPNRGARTSVQQTTTLTISTNTAAEPMSLARPTSSWNSGLTLSAIASIDEFRSSADSTSSSEPNSSTFSTGVCPSKNASGPSTTKP